jgi:hypothetical protein
MTLIRPRLNDHFGLPFTQEEVDFVIPYLDEDVPLYLDPFLLWKSPSQQDNSLHTAIVNSFNHLGYSFNKGKEKQAVETLIQASECNEVGLGDSRKRIGLPIGQKVAENTLSLYRDIPQINKSGFIHFEEIQLYIEYISKDRISDIACNFLKSFLIDFTIYNCNRLNIPITSSTIRLYDYKKNKFITESVSLPLNPTNNTPILLVPKRWLSLIPWINYDDYTKSYFTQKVLRPEERKPDYNAILNFNRKNYDLVQAYIQIKESQLAFCKNDPLYKPLPVYSIRRKLSTILSLPTGKSDKADKTYEENICQIMISILYPQLDYADVQSRTDSGVLIRDLVFYNNKSYDALKEIYESYGCRQIIFEIKNVRELEGENINQLNRYLSAQFGRFGLIVTRNRASKKIFKNTLDLWAGQRKCILILDDEDLRMMCQLYETKQRLPIDVIKMKYLEFTRACAA